MAASDVTTVSDEHVLNEAAKWREAGKNVALATVVSSWGSSPRPSGSQLAVSDDGTFVGSVSGGCIEGAVVTEALEVMKTKVPKVLDYGITNELAWEVGLACGGQVKIFVEALD
jgi:xanthine/CO dehydrogenase XdhC/CoxF family maturation factor